MFYVRLIFAAIRSLEANFLRSLLATLGVLIGVASVVAAMSILEGFSSDIAKRFKSLGSNVIYVMPARTRIGGGRAVVSQSLSLQDVGRLKRELGAQIDGVAAEASDGATVKRFRKSDQCLVVAISNSYFDMNAFETQSGAIFAADDNNVVLLGEKVATTLFGGGGAVGQTVKLRNTGYRVVGVMEKKGNLGFLNVDECVFIPIRFGLKRFLNRKWVQRLTVSANDPKKLDQIETAVKRVLRNSHDIRAGQPDDFRIFRQEEAMESVKQLMFVFRIVFYSIAGISLVVGGIGIMNIMLVSVTERTREIGVRMAVGARRSDILLQFLVEATVISGIGGGFGLLLGAMFADLLEKILKGILSTEISQGIVLVALITSTAVGIVSGIYPAYKAARLDPVEALRYE